MVRSEKTAAPSAACGLPQKSGGGRAHFCIDPESEYKDMCRNLNGSWLNAGGGKNGRSNLLQIRPAPRDDDDETDKLYTDEGNGMSDMALHMKTLEIEFSLYLPSLTDMQKAILKQTIIENCFVIAILRRYAAMLVVPNCAIFVSIISRSCEVTRNLS